MKHILLIVLCLLPLISNANDYSGEFTNTANKYLYDSDPNITGALSIQFAIKPDGSALDTEGIVTQYGVLGSSRSFSVVYKTTGEVAFTIVGSGPSYNQIQTSAAISTTDWTCFLMVYEPSTAQEIYLDEGCDDEPSLNSSDYTGIYSSLQNGNANVYVGGYEQVPASANNMFDGKIDDVRIWSEVHDDTNDWNCQVVGTEANLQAYWTLNNTLSDLTSNGYDLTNVGSVDLTASSSPISASCGVSTGTSTKVLILPYNSNNMPEVLSATASGSDYIFNYATSTTFYPTVENLFIIFLTGVITLAGMAFLSYRFL